MVTTEENFVYKDETEVIKIDNWNEALDNFLESLEEIKRTSKKTAATSMVEEDTKLNLKESKIAILIPDPINKNIKYDLQKILKPFKNFNLNIDYFHLTLDKLNELEGYQYIFIFTSSVQSKIYVEDDYLSSNLITLEALESEIFIEDLKGLFIFTDKEFKLTTKDFQFPLVLFKYGEKNWSSLIFQLFKKCEIPSASNSFQFLNFTSSNLTKLAPGRLQVNFKKTTLPSEIDSKNLINFIGRKSDLESLSRKILELDGQLLTLKASGGLGKTTIIKKVAVELGDRNYFSEGIHFIDCEHISDYSTLEYKIGLCFEIDNTIDLREHIYQNSMYTNKLLILDNFESLLYIEDKIKIKELVAFICDYVTLVTTSREWIGFEFEEQYELRALTTDEGVNLFQKYYKYPISEIEMKVLRSDIIENLLNNNPLAIKIITSNIPKSKNMINLKEELEEDFFNTTTMGIEDIFGEGVDNNIERTNSLYQSINYSYSKLSNKESLFFELLSLFPDGIHMRNFIEFFNGKANKLTDKEIKSLENKSLIQISGGFIKLQSIVGRFASHRFSKRNNTEEEFYYNRAYEYNDFMVSFLEDLRNNMDLPEKKELEIFDNNLENFSKSFEYLTRIKEDKINLLIYISKLTYYYSVINQRTKFIGYLENLKGYFDDVEKADLLFDALIIQLGYYNGEFKESLSQANDLFPLDEVLNIKVDAINNKIESLIFSHILTVHVYGNEYQILKRLIDIGDIYKGFYGDLFFSIGMYNFLNKHFPFDKRKDFFDYEVLSNKDLLKDEELDKAIERIYNKDYLTLMQLNYLKAKRGLLLDKDVAKKLVVINPYTKGLKNLMYAFIENEFEKAYELYKLAINQLEHIKYYYIEAIFYFSKFLYEHDSDEFNEWVNTGKSLAKEYHYYFLIYKFDALTTKDKKIYYEEKNIFTPQEVAKIEEILKKNKNVYT
jgi:hypothetical protein